MYYCSMKQITILLTIFTNLCYASFPIDVDMDGIIHQKEDPLFTADTAIPSIILVLSLMIVFFFRRSSLKSLDSNQRRKWRVSAFIFSALLLFFAIIFYAMINSPLIF